MILRGVTRCNVGTILYVSSIPLAFAGFGGRRPAPPSSSHAPFPLSTFDFTCLLYGSWALAIVALYCLTLSRPKSMGRKVNVVLVGCGMPKKSMGWYHLTQLLKMPRARVTDVVEPFFLGVCSDVPERFTSFMSDLQSRGIKFHKSLAEVGDEFPPKTMVLISARTSDNPGHFEAALDRGAKCIYLEKPGAPTVKELVRMKHLASSRTVPCQVYLGYNKNVTRYVRSALAYADSVPGSHVEFVHNNAFRPEELEECFARCAEGMLKNMAIHELALLVTFFDARVDTVFKVKVDPSKTALKKLGPWEDFSKLSFRITTLKGLSATVTADRCTGTVSYANVRDGPGGKVLRAFECPTKEEAEEVKEKVKADPEIMEYFLTQDADYWNMKETVLEGFADGTGGGDVATIDVGIEALKLAEFITKSVKQQLG